MVTFYVTSRYFGDNSANFLEYKNMTETDLAQFICKNNCKLIMIEPSPFVCAFRKVFIEPILNSEGIVKEGVFITKLNGSDILYRIVFDIQYKIAKNALKEYNLKLQEHE